MVLALIIAFGLLMSVIALVGSVTLVLSEATLNRVLMPLVAFAAGTLIGGALFHMIPAAVEAIGNVTATYVWIVVGFVLFLALEQFLDWHHSHSTSEQTKRPLTYLILVADGLHNFIGGLFVGASFLADIRLGMTAWFVAAVHEVPQELGDFAVLVHGGWSKSSALIFNFISALSFPLGAVIAYILAAHIDVAFLIPFAAGNFLYIGAADLIPEIKARARWRTGLLHLAAFILGLAILLAVRFA